MITNTTEISLTRLNYIKQFHYNEGAWLAGGALRASIIGEKIQDYDIFGSSIESLSEFVSNNLKGYRRTHFSDNVDSYRKGKIKVQIIKGKLYTDMESCIQDFDFTVSMFAYNGVRFIGSPEAIIDLFKKKIVINKIKEGYEFDTLRRLQKYIQYGFSICNEGMKKIGESFANAKKESLENQFQFYWDGSERIMRFD